MKSWPHLHIDLYGCSQNLEETNSINTLMNSLPDLVGMRTLVPAHTTYYGEDNFDGIPDRGVSSTIIIATSHASLHTFANMQYVTADLYSCRPFNIDLIVDALKSFFKPDVALIRNLNRGPNFDSSNLGRFLDVAIQVQTKDDQLGEEE